MSVNHEAVAQRIIDILKNTAGLVEGTDIMEYVLGINVNPIQYPYIYVNRGRQRERPMAGDRTRHDVQYFIGVFASDPIPNESLKKAWDLGNKAKVALKNNKRLTNPVDGTDPKLIDSFPRSTDPFVLGPTEDFVVVGDLVILEGWTIT